MSFEKVVMKKEEGSCSGRKTTGEWRKRDEEVDWLTKAKRGRRYEGIPDDERCQVRQRRYNSYPKITKRRNASRYAFPSVCLFTWV